MTIDALRAEFPALDDGLTFLDWASTGLVPERTRRRIHEYVDQVARCESAASTWMHVAMGDVRQDVRRMAGQLLNARPDAVALMESTTAGLNVATQAIAMEPGANVVLSGVDYPAVARPWMQRAEREDLKLRFVAPLDGRMTAERLLEHVDAKTRVVAVSTVVWTTGELLDVEALAEALADHDVTLILDAVQTFGVVPLDLSRFKRAFVAMGGHKWLCSPLGAGLLAVGEDAAARFRPPVAGFLSAKPPRGNFGAWFQDETARPDESLEYPRAGRAFEVGGTPSYPGALGLSGMLELLVPLEPGALLRRVRGLADSFAADVAGMGLPLVISEASERAGVVTFHVPGGVAAEIALADRLKAERIVVSVRYGGGIGGLRVSFHGMNRADDGARAAEAVRRSLRGR